MRYAYFEFENFKGIKEARLNLDTAGGDARVFTLVGLNESGKTTILEAIDHFVPRAATADALDREVSPKELAGWVEPDPDDLIPIAERTNFNGHVIIRAGVVLDDTDVAAIIKTVKSQTGFRLTEVTRSIDITIDYAFENSRFTDRTTRWTGDLGKGYKRTGAVLRTVTHTGEQRQIWVATLNAIRSRLPVIWFFPNFLFEFPRRINLVPAATESQTNRFYRALFQDVLDALGKDLDVADHVVSRARSGDSSDQKNLRQLLVDASRDVTQNVVSAWNELFGGKELSDKRVQIEYSVAEAEEDGTERDVFVEFWLEDSDGLFGIHERSLGFRWFFVYLLMTTYRGQRRGGANDILFLFDEPASNLHPRAQSALLSSLEQLSHNAVVVYTTHSHHLINPAWLGSAFVVINEGLDPRAITASVTARRTDVKVQPFNHFASQHPHRTHFFQPVLDVLEYAPSELEMVPAIAMVEGKTDYYLLRYIQEIILDRRKSDHLPLLPGTGAGTLDAVIQLYAAWGREFVILLDSDSTGIREKERYEKKFGSLVHDRLFTLRDIVKKKDLKAIETILTEGDRKRFQALIDPEVTDLRKKDISLGIQLAYARREKLSVSVSGTRNSTSILDYLREKLEQAV